ncbi:uncharacterized protein LOC114440924 [Parambassis ranga]|uniref:Uncharacterized protein LOC114440924 n=1 Tax=Parambassis ranga TaxID=210632 RepID=A0A6P7IYF9_9TELE|nr:uncharacterized protein LOC114440924 [Parambassis ranga]
MEYCTLKGFLVIWLIKHCTSEDLSTSIQSSTTVAHQDGQTLPQEPGLPPADVVPIVSPPSLQEVEQAVQEASEQAEGRGAEKVMKELLERVVEAALGQAEGGNEAKVEAVEEEDDDTLGVEIKESEADAEAEVMKAVGGETVGIKEGNPGVGENQEAEEVDALEDITEKGEGIVEGEREAAAGLVEKSTAGVEIKKAEGMEVIDESLGAEISQEVVEGAAADSEETGGDSAVEEAGEEDSKEEEAAENKETEIKEVEEGIVEVAVGGEAKQETGPVLADVEQTGHALGTEDAPVEESPVEGMEGGPVVLPDIVTTQTVEPVDVEEKEEEVNIVEHTAGTEVEAEQGHLVDKAEEIEEEGADMGTAGAERDGGGVNKEESVVNEGGDQKAGAEEQIALGTKEVHQEEPVIPGPEPEDGEVSIEQSLENQAPTPNSSLTEAETGAYSPDGGETSDHGNEIITPTDDLLAHGPAVVQPTQNNFVKDTPPEHPQAEGEEPGEVNELVEDTAGTAETNELGLEAWKIGAISAAVFLVLETVVIIIYILKCRNKNSTPALQRACEEGCVEPEAATGGDCSDDTLPVGNGDTQQKVVLDPSDVASTLANTKEQQEDEHVIAMSDLPPGSTEESANTGPEPDSTQDLRTSSML